MKKTSTRRDLFNFLKNPNFDKQQDTSIKTKILILLKVLILTYIGIIVANLPFQILKGLNIIGEISSNVNIAVDTIKEQNIGYKPYFIFSSILLVPLLEETAFRLFLSRFKINYFIISVSVILGALILHFISTLLWRPESFLLFSLSTYFYVLIISGVIGLVLWLLRAYLAEIKNFWNNKTGYIFYSVAVLFALFHFMSINLNGNNPDYLNSRC